ncbi:RNA polymerase sigma factor [Xylanimonas protaetiae]|uniref:RNA polymerase sigma factor n=1 Tax=Xylanimonas protaetiae TaxID=2509457 RepID=UPI001F5C3DE0|nr:RNA polymerase sigma factor [Xylanimonas protaetiae]
MTEWWRDHAGRVQAYALRHVDPHSAQEVVAETFLIAWRRDSDVPGDVLPWLFGVARNVIRNQRRAARRAEALVQRLAYVTVQDREDPSADVAVTAREEMLLALAQLTDSHREALLLIAWDGLTREQAAEVAGCRVGTFDVRLSRARKRLAELLADAGHNPAPTRRLMVVEPVRPGGTR